MKTFQDLTFESRTDIKNTKHALEDLGNGLIISVVQGPNHYSESDTYEVGVLFGNDMVPLQPFDEVLGWQTEQQITELMQQVQTDKNFVKSKVDAKHDAMKQLSQECKNNKI